MCPFHFSEMSEGERSATPALEAGDWPEDDTGPRKPPRGKFQLFCKKGMGEFSKGHSVGLMMPLTLFLTLDLQIYNVAVYPISVYYNVSTTLSQWMILIRSIMNTTFCLFTSLILDKLGMRKHLIICMLGISIAQMVMPWGPFWMVMLFRALECMFIALVTSLSTSSLRLLTDASQLRSAIGLTTVIRSISTAMAPTLGGIMCDSSFGWRTIPLLLGSFGFLVFIIGLLCFPNIYLPKKQHVKDAKVTRNPNFDIIGALTLVGCFLMVSVMFAIFSLVPWYYSLILIIVAGIMLTIFVFHERRLECNHIVSPSILHNRPIMFGLATSIAMPMSQKIMGVLIPLMFQQVYGLSSTLTGICQSIMTPLGQVVGGIVIPILCKKFSSNKILSLCMLCTGLIGFVISLSFMGPSWLLLAILGVLYSFSAGFAFITNSSSILIASPRELGPMVGSLQTLFGSFSGSIGTTLAVTVRDALVPIFEDPANPTQRRGLRMGSLISGSIISAVSSIASITAYLTKPKYQNNGIKVDENAEISVSLNGSSSKTSNLSDSNKSEIKNVESLSEQKSNSLN